jgi:hypothetical protein
MPENCSNGDEGATRASTGESRFDPIVSSEASNTLTRTRLDSALCRARVAVGYVLAGEGKQDTATSATRAGASGLRYAVSVIA